MINLPATTDRDDAILAEEAFQEDQGIKGNIFLLCPTIIQWGSFGVGKSNIRFIDSVSDSKHSVTMRDL